MVVVQGKITQYVFFQLLGYPRLVSRLSLESDMDLKEKERNIVQEQEELQKTVDGSEELQMLWCRACTDVSVLQL